MVLSAMQCPSRRSSNYVTTRYKFCCDFKHRSHGVFTTAVSLVFWNLDTEEEDRGASAATMRATTIDIEGQDRLI